MEVSGDRGVEIRRGGELHDLLVTALHRAVALEEVDGVARAIGEHLHLDVARPQDGLFQEHPRVSEGAAGLAHRLVQRRSELVLRLDAAHAAPTAARDGLREQREADVVRLGDEGVDIVGRLGRTQNGHAGRNRVLLRRDLVARHLEHVRGRPDERDPVLRRLRREIRVLREEPVARVDRVGAGLNRDTHDLVDIEIRTHGVPLGADLVGLVCLQTVQGVAVFQGEDGDGAGSQLIRGAERSDRYFTAIGDEDLREHVPPLGQIFHRQIGRVGQLTA